MIPVAKEKHPFLLFEDQIMVNVVRRGRSEKICEHCKQVIPLKTEHKVHIFIPGYDSYATHLECSLPFASTLG